MIRVYEYIVVNHIDVTVSPIDKLLQAILRKDKIRECTLMPSVIMAFSVSITSETFTRAASFVTFTLSREMYRRKTWMF